MLIHFERQRRRRKRSRLTKNRFLLNNNGYTIERLIHGWTAPYNDVPKWDYGALLQAFGPDFKTKHYLVKTPDELDKLLADEEFNEAKYAQVSRRF